jgi:hypothetical protein
MSELEDTLAFQLDAVGNVLLNQDGALDEDVRMAEDAWRALVRRACE